jgi:hypothetical protein
LRASDARSDCSGPPSIAASCTSIRGLSERHATINDAHSDSHSRDLDCDLDCDRDRDLDLDPNPNPNPKHDTKPNPNGTAGCCA